MVFIKFPITYHLSFSKITDREDKVLPEKETEEFLEQKLIVQEKFDGTNIGISFQNGDLMVQNRGSYLCLDDLDRLDEYKGFTKWINQRKDSLKATLTSSEILFIEWMYWEHTVKYDSLPDLGIGLDIYKKKNDKFLNTSRVKKILSGKVFTPEILYKGKITPEIIEELLNQNSSYSNQPREGLILRQDSRNYNIQRAKIVSDKFQISSTHWKSVPKTANICKYNINFYDL